MFKRFRNAWSNLGHLQFLLSGGPTFHTSAVTGGLSVRPGVRPWLTYTIGPECERTNGRLDPVVHETLPAHTYHIGVLGSSSTDFPPAAADACHRLGKAIAHSYACLVTGAGPGLPHLVAMGAKEEGGTVIGISAASSLREHSGRYESPFRECDTIVYTGLGPAGQKLVTIRSCDIVIIVGGQAGTLSEFAVAYDEGKLIGVLMGTGGITDSLPKLEQRFGKGNGVRVLYDGVPERLVERLIAQHDVGELVLHKEAS